MQLARGRRAASLHDQLAAFSAAGTGSPTAASEAGAQADLSVHHASRDDARLRPAVNVAARAGWRTCRVPGCTNALESRYNKVGRKLPAAGGGGWKPGSGLQLASAAWQCAPGGHACLFACLIVRISSTELATQTPRRSLGLEESKDMASCLLALLMCTAFHLSPRTFRRHWIQLMAVLACRGALGCGQLSSLWTVAQNESSLLGSHVPALDFDIGSCAHSRRCLQKYRICDPHYSMTSLVLNGALVRFCQQASGHCRCHSGCCACASC